MRRAAPGLAQPRAEGEGRVAVRLARGRSRLRDLYQRGSAKILLPTTEGAAFEAVLLNTAGGLTGGDRFDWRAEAAEGAALTLSTQAAERIYRAHPGEEAQVATRLTAGPGATLDWLPQETILFDGGALRRRLEIELDPTASFTGIEPLILGRAAMGETVREAAFRDRWRLRVGGELVWADALRLVGPVADIAARPACFGGGIAAATLVHAAPGAPARLAELRGLLSGHAGVEAGASALDGLVAARLVARDGRALRRALIAVLSRFRAGPPPRVWTM
ncbi:MAG: urease accessory protein UreD [Pseudomonadota bacterium]|nr:urease accessory protein UreD [Pseudomonadota bacterium]